MKFALLNRAPRRRIVDGDECAWHLLLISSGAFRGPESGTTPSELSSEPHPFRSMWASEQTNLTLVRHYQRLIPRL